MRTYHPIQRIEHLPWHEVLYDRRVWAIVGIVAFVVIFTALVIISAKTGAGTTGQPWPYIPYGPMPYGPVAP